MEEKEKAMQTGFILDTYIDEALKVLEKLNPVHTLIPLIVSKEKGAEPLVDPRDNRVKAIVDTWLTMFDNVLKEGKELPVDLIGRAAEIAKSLREKKTPQT